MHPLNIEADKSRHVVIDFTNHRNERKEYTILPHSVFFSKSKFHPIPCWLLEATDVNRNVVRHFAMDQIHSWKVAP